MSALAHDNFTSDNVRPTCPTCQQVLPAEPVTPLTELENYLNKVYNETVWCPYKLYSIDGSCQVYTQEMIDIMREIIAAGGEISSTNTIGGAGYSPLHMAYIHRNKILIEFLLEIGADTEAVINGKTPLDKWPDYPN